MVLDAVKHHDRSHSHGPRHLSADDEQQIEVPPTIKNRAKLLIVFEYHMRDEPSILILGQLPSRQSFQDVHAHVKVFELSADSFTVR